MPIVEPEVSYLFISLLSILNVKTWSHFWCPERALCLAQSMHVIMRLTLVCTGIACLIL